MSLKTKRFFDGIAIIWLAVWGYLSTIGAGLVSFPGSSWWWLTSPLFLVPSIVWLGWSIYQQEGHGPARITTQSAAFGAGVILLGMQFPPIAQALSSIL